MNARLAPPNDRDDQQIARQIQRMTRRSFAVGALAAAGGLAGWSWLSTRPDDQAIPWPLRRMLQWNEQFARAYFRPTRMAPTFSKDTARMPRVDGQIGLGGHFDPATWALRVENTAGAKALSLTLKDIQALPRVDAVMELKCIEGWSDPVRWTGARMSDLVAKFGRATRSGREIDLEHTASDLFRYVMLSTPDAAYYVGLDIESALHPQTLLCYEMNGEPLTPGHGAPLRLAIPVKYGIKNIKRIGTIRFTDERPADYWAERGYDWYAGL
jgi:hypothetical protein